MWALVLLAMPSADDAAALLRRVADRYEKLASFELSASLSVEVPGQDLIITTGQTAVYATGPKLPADAPVPVIEIGTLGGRPVSRNRAGQEVKATISGFGVEGFSFYSLAVVDKRVISARMLPDGILVLGGQSLPCSVIEVLYEKRTPFDAGSGRPVRLWIEKNTSLVRQAVYERGWGISELARWTARVENMTLDQPPPQWAVDRAEVMKGREVTKWIGQPTPEFALKSLDGTTVSLASMHGKVLVLNFWATWCGPCREEMPLLEKLREEMTPRGVEIWGVTDEPPDVARGWLSDRKRTLPTLIDSDRRLFRHFEVESIPVLVVVRGDGKVSTFVVGLRGEHDLRASIGRAME